MSTEEETKQKVLDAIELESINKRNFEQAQKALKIEQERSVALGNNVEALQKQYEIRQLGLESLRTQLELVQQGKADFAAITQSLEQNKELQVALAAEAAKQGLKADELLDKYSQMEDGAQELINLTQSWKAELADSATTAGILQQKTGKFAKSMGMASKFSETTAGQITEIGLKLLDSAKRGESLGTMLFSAFSEAFDLRNILGSAADIVLELVISVDNMSKSFAAARGFTGDFRGEMLGVARELAGAGVTADEVGQSYGALADGFSKFDKTNKSTNKALMKSVALMSKLGVTSADAVSNMNFFSESLGMSEMQAMRLTEEIATMGDEMGFSAQRMTTDFKSAASTLAVYGDRMVGVFKELQATAKGTGLTISELTTMVSKFDTFSGAAEQAGSLNAVLGTNISAMEMLNMNEADRVDMLRTQIRASVGSLDNLDKFTQKYVAQALGLNDVAKAQALVNMTDAEYLANQSKQDNAAKTQEEMLALSESLVPIMDKLKMAFLKVAVASGPLIEGLTAAVDAFASFIDPIAMLVGWAMQAEQMYTAISMVLINFFVPAVKVLYAQVLKLNFAMLRWTIIAMGLYALTQLDGVMRAFAAGVVILAMAFTSLNAATKKQIAAFLIINEIMHMTMSPEFYLLFGVMAIGVLFLARSLQTLKGQAMLAALVLALLAGAVSLIFYGIAAMAEALTGLMTIMFQNLTQIPLMVAGLYAMAGGFAAMGASAAYAALGVTASLASLIVMMGVLGAGGISFGDVLGAGEAVNKLGAGMEKLSKGMSEIMVMALAFQALGGKGFLAVTSDGTSKSAIVGSDEIMQNFVDGKLTVDVNIPEIKLPEITLNVRVDRNDNVSVERVIADI